MIVGLLLAASLPDASLLPLLRDHFDSYLLANAITGKIASSNMTDKSVTVGSLIKPFTAIAYSESGHAGMPHVVCNGATCWRKSGHGRLNFAQALSVSCNTYFRQLAANINPGAMERVLRAYGVSVSSRPLTEEARLGLGDALRVTPSSLVHAYSELFQRSSQPVIKDILHGMRLAATSGTAKEWRGKVLSKTGTAHCDLDEGDGFALVAWPADSPKTIVLVRDHRKTGAATVKKLAAYIGPLWGLE